MDITIKRINESKINEIVVTDSLPIKPISDKIKVLSIAGVFADVINKVHNYQSISTNFIV